MVASIVVLGDGIGRPVTRDFTRATAEAYAARTVALVRQSFAQGNRDVGRLLTDRDLAPLRGRADFAALLWDLAEAGGRY